MAYAFQDKQVLGTWNFYGTKYQIKARTFDNGASFWLTQAIIDNPEQFVVRGRNLLNDTSMEMSSGVPRSVYTDLAGGDTGAGGQNAPTSFATPSNYTKKLYGDQTPYYELNGVSGCVLSDGLVVGTFNGNGHPLQALQNNGKWYVIQVENSNPMEFVVRGANILSAGQFATVTKAACIGAFTSEPTGNGGSLMPDSFTTPGGFTRGTYPDKTTYFKKTEAGAVVKPTISVATSLNQDADGKYLVALGQKISITSVNANDNAQWWANIAGTDKSLGLYTNSIEYVITDNEASVYLVNRSAAGVSVGESNRVVFKVSNAAAQKSVKPTLNSASVFVGQPIIIFAGQGATLRGGKNGGEPKTLTPTAGTGTRYEYFPDSPAVGDQYIFLQTEPGKTESDAVTVTMAGNPSSVCDKIADGTPLGVWNQNSSVLIARKFNNVLWVTQRTGTSPDSFMVRGKNMLTRPDVTSEYKACTDRLSGADTGVSGLVGPSEFPNTIPGYTKKTFPSGDPYWESSVESVSTPVPQITSGPTSVVGGTIKGLVGVAGTINVYRNGASKTQIQVTGAWSYSPDESGTYTFRLVVNGGATSSASDAVVVSQVTPGSGTGACAINDKQEIGTVKGSGDKIIARSFDGQMWITQQTGTNPDKFSVKGANYIQNTDQVTTTYGACKSVFAGGDTEFGGNVLPTAFKTPTGYQVGYYSDKSPYFIAITNGTTPTGTTPTSPTGTGTEATQAYDVQVTSTCGSPLEYAVSKTITDWQNTGLVYQPSKRFLLSGATWYIHFRQIDNKANGNTVQEVITLATNS